MGYTGVMKNYDTKLHEVPKTGDVSLPNGYTLYWKFDPSVNCREYWSDEIGGGVMVWNTALVDQHTLLAAILQEATLNKLEKEHFVRNQNRMENDVKDMEKLVKENDGRCPFCSFSPTSTDDYCTYHAARRFVDASKVVDASKEVCKTHDPTDFPMDVTDEELFDYGVNLETPISDWKPLHVPTMEELAKLDDIRDESFKKLSSFIDILDPYNID